jgi:uncharacterized membrane protein
MMPGGPATTSIREILMGVANFIGGKIMPILVALAILTFLVNIISFIASSGNERKRETFRNYMINSLIAMFILISIWGIVGLGTRTLFGTKPFIPQLPTSDQ